MLKIKSLLIILSYFLLCVKPTCELFKSELECNQSSSCLWKSKCLQKQLVVRSANAKSQPERENENETETEMESGAGMQQAAGCASLTEAFCKIYAGSCNWTLQGCVMKQAFVGGGSSNPLIEREFESESETGMAGNSQMQYQSNFPVEHEYEHESEQQIGYIGYGAMPLPQYPAGGPSMEFEHESESESSSQIPSFPGNTIPGPPGGIQFESETESETQSGASHTYEYERESNSPVPSYEHVVNNGAGTLVDNGDGTGLRPLLPSIPSVPAVDSGLVTPILTPTDPVGFPSNAGPSNADMKLQCLAKSDAEQCAAVLICEWDSRGICVPKGVPVASLPPKPKCSNIKLMIPCVDQDGCEWDIATQACKMAVNRIFLSKIQTCTGIARQSCGEFFGCAWDHDKQLCAPVSNAQDPVTHQHTHILRKPRQIADYQPTDYYSDSPAVTDLPAEPKSSTYCLLKTISECRPDPSCFWDSRKICLPKEMQLETTVTPVLDPNYNHVNNFFHPTPNQNYGGGAAAATASQDIHNKAQFFHPQRPNDPNPPGAPGRGMQELGDSGTNPTIPMPPSPAVESETESESEGEYQGLEPQSTAAINTCFFHPDRQTCLEDNGCFWDRRTRLCASLEVPNFLPATCEGFLYEEPCTQDKRCIWKTGECEEANLDCEDMTTRDRCLRTKYNGIPCIWSDHEQECDEAPIMLQKSNTKNRLRHQAAEFFFLGPFLVIVPLLLIVFFIARKAYLPSSSKQEDLLLDDAFPKVHRVV